LWSSDVGARYSAAASLASNTVTPMRIAYSAELSS
jgi:hypothetical protein